MPFSLDPAPKDDELECARCGAYFYHELTRCPSCGVNIYEPEEADKTRRSQGLFGKMISFFRQKFGRSTLAEDLFADAQAHLSLYQELLARVGGDETIAESLIRFEARQKPTDTRAKWIKNALERWERDNRILRTGR